MEYTYSGLNILNKNNTFERTFETVYICAYKINTEAMIPFIQYLLYKNNTLTFPSFKYKKKVIDRTIGKCYERK